MDSEERFDTVLFFLFAVCAVTGTFVIAAFVLPRLVGSLISGKALLVTALTFVGALLAILSILPAGGGVDRQYFSNAEDSVLDSLSIDALFDEIDPVVFALGGLLPLLGVLALLTFESRVTEAVSGTRDFFLTDASVLFLWPMLLFVLFAVGLMIGPWGSVKLGEGKPEYSYPSYFAMVFSAGIAAGIVFWGPAEALFHYSSPAPLAGAEGGSGGAIGAGLQQTLFHWGLTAWSAYIVIGLPVAYFAYNRGVELKVSAVLTPFVGGVLAPLVGEDEPDGPAAKLVDVLAVFATVGGVATTMGLISRQFLAGIEYQWGVGYGDVATTLLVLMLTVIFTVSVVTGIQRGIRRISSLNTGLFVAVTVVVLFVGPTVFILERSAQGLLGYVVGFLPLSLYPGTASSLGWPAFEAAATVTPGVSATTGGVEWLSDWTVFYWAWWLSWAPFVGLFVAYISRGRTIRTVVGTGFIATTLATFAWFLVIGGTSLHAQHSGVVDVLGAIGAADAGTAVAGYALFTALPLGNVLVLAFAALVLTFVITSTDSSTLGIALLTTEETDDPSSATRVFWGVFQGVIATVLIVTGGSGTLQTAAVLTGGPFAVVGVVAIVATLVELRRTTAEPGPEPTGVGTPESGED